MTSPADLQNPEEGSWRHEKVTEETKDEKKRLNSPDTETLRRQQQLMKPQREKQHTTQQHTQHTHVMTVLMKNARSDDT